MHISDLTGEYGSLNAAYDELAYVDCLFGIMKLDASGACVQLVSREMNNF